MANNKTSSKTSGSTSGRSTNRVKPGMRSEAGGGRRSARGPHNRAGSNRPTQGEFVQKELTGALFHNDQPNRDTSPDYLGSVTVDGRKYWVSAWANESRNGRRYLGMRLRPVEEDAPESDEEVPF